MPQNDYRIWRQGPLFNNIVLRGCCLLRFGLDIVIGACFSGAVGLYVGLVPFWWQSPVCPKQAVIITAWSLLGAVTGSGSGVGSVDRRIDCLCSSGLYQYVGKFELTCVPILAIHPDPFGCCAWAINTSYDVECWFISCRLLASVLVGRDPLARNRAPWCAGSQPCLIFPLYSSPFLLMAVSGSLWQSLSLAWYRSLAVTCLFIRDSYGAFSVSGCGVEQWPLSGYQQYLDVFIPIFAFQMGDLFTAVDFVEELHNAFRFAVSFVRMPLT